MKNPFSKSKKSEFGTVINEEDIEPTKSQYGIIIDKEDIVGHPSTSIHYTSDRETIAKLKKVAPFLSMMRDMGMSYRQISEVLESLTGLTINPNRVRKYIIKHNPPTVRIVITDRIPEEDGD
jgi:hypothetical protein|tara:strand:- start:939 stop:1304 length:366 start_codon:yes stop_codon:yes gene_type:complete